MTRLALLCGLVLITIAATAQQLYVGPTTDAEIRWAKAADFDGSILFCRGHYASDRHEANGSGWWTDYPGADHNFLVRLAELTEVRVRFSPGRIPFYVVIPLYDALLFKCPLLIMEDVGTIRFREDEVSALREYFEKGGFLWVDDFWGSEAWRQWEDEIRRVLPSATYPMIDVPKDHPLFHQLYDVDGIWQMPTIGLWGTCGGGMESHDGESCVGGTSERGPDSLVPTLRGILDAKGRIIVVSTHNTDVNDSFEEEKPQNQAFIDEFSARGYALGTNIFLYAITH